MAFTPISAVPFDDEEEDKFSSSFSPISTEPIEPSSTLRRTLGDQLAVPLLKGVISVPEAIVGLADYPTMGLAGRAAEAAGIDFKRAKEVADTFYSPEQQTINQKVAKAEGFMPTVQALAQNPSYIAQQVVENAPTMLLGGAIGRGIAATTKVAPWLAGAVGEGAITAGQNLEQVRQESPTGLVSPEQAGLVGLSGVITGGISAAGGKLSNKLGLVDPETWLAGGKLPPGVNPLSAPRRILGGVVSEGLLQEAPQSYQEQVLQNLAEGKPWDEGAAKAAVIGGVVGGVMGGGANIIGQRPLADRAPTQPQETSETESPPLALPAPGIAMRDATGDVPNEEQRAESAAIQGRTDALYAARAAEEQRLAALGEPPLDPNAGTVQKIGAIAQAAGATPGSLAERAGNIAPTEEERLAAQQYREEESQRIWDERMGSLRQAISYDNTVNGPSRSQGVADNDPAAATAAEAARAEIERMNQAKQSTGAEPDDRQSLMAQRVAEERAKAQQPTEVSNALEVGTASPLGALPGGAESVGRQEESAGVGQGDQLQQAPSADQPGAGLAGRASQVEGEVAPAAEPAPAPAAAPQATTLPAQPVAPAAGPQTQPDGTMPFTQETNLGPTSEVAQPMGSRQQAAPAADPRTDAQVAQAVRAAGGKVVPSREKNLAWLAESVGKPGIPDAENVGKPGIPEIATQPTAQPAAANAEGQPDAAQRVITAVRKAEAGRRIGNIAQSVEDLIAQDKIVPVNDINDAAAKMAERHDMTVDQAYEILKQGLMRESKDGTFNPSDLLTINSFEFGGRNYAIAPKVEQNPVGLTLHEVGVHLRQNPQFDRAALAMINGRAKAATPELRQMLDTVAQRMEDAQVAGQRREAMSYTVEEAAKVGGFNGSSVIDGKFMSAMDKISPELGKLIRQVVASVRAYMAQKGMKLNLRVDDLVAIARANVISLGKEEGGRFDAKTYGLNGAQFSRDATVPVWARNLNLGRNDTVRLSEPVGNAQPGSYQIMPSLGEAYLTNMVTGERVRVPQAAVEQAAKKGQLEWFTEPQFSRDVHRGGTTDEVGSFKIRTHKDGTLVVSGDADAIRAQIPSDVTGRAVQGGIIFTNADAPRVRAALEGKGVAYGRAGAVLDRLPMKDGKYLGAPEKYNTPAKIPTLRRNLRKLAAEGAPGRFWYENSSREILALAGGDVTEARKFVALLAIYSPQARVDGNGTFALRAWAQYKAGQPISVKTKVQDTKAQKALADIDAFWSGEKTGNFFFNLLREIDPSTAGKQGATIDMWMMRAGEYSNDAPTKTQYAFMEHEINRIAQELGWEPQQVQAAIWVAMKARTENPGVKKRTEASSEKKGWLRYDYPVKNDKPTKTRVILDEQAHRDNWLKHAFAHDPTSDDTALAKFDFSDALRRHIGQISWEARPGRSTNVLPGVNDAPYAQQVEFQQAIHKALLDDNGIDLLAQKLGLLIDGSDVLAPRVWQGEVAAGMQKRVGMAPSKGGEASIDPAQKQALDAYVAMLGILLRQEGVGYHRPFYKGNKSAENGVDIRIGRTFTPDEARALWAAIDERMRAAGVADWENSAGLISAPTGMRVVNFGALGDNRLFQRLVEDAAGTLSVDELRTGFFASDGDLVTNDWKENPNGEGYQSRITAAGRPDLLGWAGTVLAPRVQAVFDDFSARYGWGDPGRIPIAQEAAETKSAEAVTSPAQRGNPVFSRSAPKASKSQPSAPRTVASEEEARQQGYTLKAYRGVDRANPYNDTGTAWLTTSRDVAEAYAEEVFAYEDPGVETVMVNPNGLPRHDMRKVTEEQLQALEPDEFGNPQKVGIYDNSDDSNLGGGYDHTVIHAPKGAMVRIGETPQFSRSSPWYSELGRKIDAAPIKSSPAPAWQQYLTGLTTKGVKPDEIEWSGIKEWLATRTGKVSKGEVKAYLDQNGVKVEETMLGADNDAAARENAARNIQETLEAGQVNDENTDYALKLWKEGDPNSSLVRQQEALLEEYLQNAGDNRTVQEHLEFGKEETDSTKFSQYTLPGGQNYRELLLTLPEKPIQVEVTPEQRAYAEHMDAMQAQYGDLWQQKAPIEDRLKADTLRRAALQSRPRDPNNPTSLVTQRQDRANFRSSHFDQPNVLAHIRFNDRTDADGKRVLFVEEIQSDWGQKGKKEGFGKVRYGVENGDGNVAFDHPAEGFASEADAKAAIAKHVKRQAEYGRSVDSSNWRIVPDQIQSGPPSAPFVTKTEAWTGLALKRILKYAIDNGYDRVAWTTGEQQAARYDLSKQVESVSYRKRGDGTYDIYFQPKGQRIMEDGPSGLSEKDLQGAVGKELAEKMIAGKGASEDLDGTDVRSFNGLDLKVGGEGMNAYYDKILPGVARDVLRKLSKGDHSLGSQTKSDEVVGNRTLTDLQAIRNLTLRQSFIDKGFEGLDAESKRLVQSHMLALGKNDEVLKAIVSRVPVDVVNVLKRTKLTPEMLFHDPAMILNRDSAKLADNVPALRDVPTSLMRAVASVAAERISAAPGRVVVGPREGSAAVGTMAGSHNATLDSGVRLEDGGAPTSSASSILQQVDIPGVGKQPAITITPAMREKAADGMPQFSRSGGQPRATQPGSWQYEGGRLDSLIYTLTDKNIDTVRVQQAIEKLRGQLNEDVDVRLQETLFAGKADKATSDFLTDEVTPLLKEMRARKVSQADIEQYLHNRHAPERNTQIAQVNPQMPDGGSGIDTADAQAYMAGLSAARRADLQAVARKVDAIIAKTRQELVNYGLESQDTINKWAATYPTGYVPLFRAEMPESMGIGQGFSVKGSASKRAMGSTLPVENILANIVLQREKAITRGEKAPIARALFGLAIANPNPEFWSVTPPTMRYIDSKTGQVESMVDPRYKNADNVVVARMPDGMGNIVERAVIFNESNPEAMRMAEAIKNLNTDQLGTVLSGVAKVTRLFSALQTQYNPVFGVVNLTRDVQTAILNLTSTPLAGKQDKVLKYTLSALRGVYKDMRAMRAGRHATSRWAGYFEDFAKQGGKTGFRDMYRTSEDRAKALEHELNPNAWMNSPLGKFFTANGVLKAPYEVAAAGARGLFGWLSDYNEAMENAVRVATYRVAVESGMSKPRAAAVAKELTVNFNRKGQIATQAGALYAFYNASAQGTVRLAKTMAGPAGKKIMVGGLTLGALQAFALAAAGFDDDEPPEFVRERNLIIPLANKKYLTIPMPLGFHVIPNIGRIFTEWGISGGKDTGKRMANLFGVFADSFNPIGSSTVLQTITPTVVDPVAALAENKDWTGKPIYKPNISGTNPTPGHTRAKDSSSHVGKMISMALNTLSGGDKYTAGMLSPTPDQIDYLIGQATGGVGREILKTSQTANAALTGEDLPTYKIPLVGRFYGDADQQAAQNSRFYDNITKLNVHEQNIKGRQRNREPIAEYLADNPEARLWMLGNQAERQIQQLNKRKRELIAKDAPKEEIKQVDDLMTQRMKMLNDRVRAAAQ